MNTISQSEKKDLHRILMTICGVWVTSVSGKCVLDQKPLVANRIAWDWSQFTLSWDFVCEYQFGAKSQLRLDLKSETAFALRFEFVLWILSLASLSMCMCIVYGSLLFKRVWKSFHILYFFLALITRLIVCRKRNLNKQ